MSTRVWILSIQVIAHLPLIPELWRQSQAIPRIDCLTRLANSVSSGFRWEILPQYIRKRVIKEDNISTYGLYKCVHTHHASMHMQTLHTCKKKSEKFLASFGHLWPKGWNYTCVYVDTCMFITLYTSDFIVCILSQLTFLFYSIL